MADSNFTFETVTVKKVEEGEETPSWYSPYDYSDRVAVNSPDGGMIIFNTKDLSREFQRMKRKNQKLRPREFYQEISKRPIINQELPEDDTEYDEELEPETEEGDKMENKTFNIKRPSKKQQPKQQTEDLTPTKQLQFSVKGMPFKITASYHDIIIKDPFIILVFDTRAKSYSKIFPEGGAEVHITTDDDIIRVKSTGLTFTHKHNEYCALYIIEDDIEDPIEEDDEQIYDEASSEVNHTNNTKENTDNYSENDEYTVD